MGSLDGITVLALEQAVAAPFATRQLADLGARVIKVERPGRGDFARDYDQSVREMSSHFVWLNRSKLSVELDLKSPGGRDAVVALAETADVVVQNLAPGAAERLGLGADALRNRNPRLIYCSISPRTGTSHATIAPYGPFECADGTVFIAVQNEREWATLCSSVLCRPDMAEDARFATNSLRLRHRAELVGIIGSVTAELMVQQATELLDRAGIANARLRTIDEFADHEQLRSRDRWRDVPSPVGPLKALLPPVVFDGEEPSMGPIPRVGEHTAEILEALRESSA